jgi:N-methylhydantoinase A/oxoprolinase/acetone carboxylase beta subunit
VSNALIERRGAVTGLVTTEGFRDVLQFVGRELRYDTYDPNIVFPRPLVPRSRSVEVTERVDGAGEVVTPFDDDSARQAIATLLARGVESIAVALINAFLAPQHERRVEELIREVDPHVPVSLSSDVFGQIREYERASATAMNAYVKPIVGEYLGAFEEGLRARGFRGQLYLMNSLGGTITPETAMRFPLQLVESGPAAGVMAASFMALRSGRGDVVSFDMGGTTAKAALVRRGRPLVSTDHEVVRVERFKRGSGLPVGISVIDLIEIGAGGGSNATVDDVGLLRVGPRSAGASPGPACYGLGGTDATVTDADVVLGFIHPDHFLGGEMQLDLEAATRAVATHVGEPLGLDPVEAASAIHRVVMENMAEAARVHAVEMNVDIRTHGLVAFGGAGPVHAFGVARRLGSPSVLCPPHAGVLSAFGLLVAPLTFEASITRPRDLDGLGHDDAVRIVEELRERVTGSLAAAGARSPVVELSVDMCYIGQGFEVATPLELEGVNGDFSERLKARFDDVYADRYGRRLDDLPARVVTWRVVGRGREPHVATDRATATLQAAGPRATRTVTFPADLGGAVEADVYERTALPPGYALEGPAIVEERNSSIVVPPGTRATVLDDLSLLLEGSGR